MSGDLPTVHDAAKVEVTPPRVSASLGGAGSPRMAVFCHPKKCGNNTCSRGWKVAQLRGYWIKLCTDLDRVADLGCALGAVVTVLYHGAGLPGAQVIARTRETFRPGETVRNWWNRASAGSADARGKW
jgi:hypothetical protein